MIFSLSAQNTASCGAPPASLMRIRERLQKRLTKVYLDGCTLRQNCGPAARDFKEIVLQRTPVAEHLTAEHILLDVRRWRPTAQTLSAGVEMAVARTATLGTLRAALADAHGIVPAEHARVCKPFAYQLKVCAC